MKRLSWAMAISGILIAGLSTSARASLLFEATLTGAAERPLPTPSPAMGFVTVLLNDAENMLTINLAFAGLLAPQTAAHIHALGGPEDVAAVRIAPPSLPLGDLIDLMVLIPDPLPGPGPLSRAAFVQGMKDGLTYFNVHSQLFPGGEIRGQLQLVPEPATLFLLASGLAGWGIVAWKRGRRK